MKAIAWLHDDSLRHWYGDTPAIYVFDDEKLRSQQWSLKRIGFVYECLLELPVEIRRGDPVQEVTSFRNDHAATQIKTLDTPDPRLRDQLAQLRSVTPVEIVPQEAFVDLHGYLDLRRFSRYWAKAEDRLFASANLIECPQNK